MASRIKRNSKRVVPSDQGPGQRPGIARWGAILTVENRTVVEAVHPEDGPVVTALQKDFESFDGILGQDDRPLPVIASGAKQSRVAREELDCFVASAPRKDEERAAIRLQFIPLSSE
jgi:hypothetical protein